MLNIHVQRKVEFVTVERPTAWIVIALLVETRGDERLIIGAPKVVKVILKQTLRLKGAEKPASMLALPAPVAPEKVIELPVKSPYVSAIFGYSNSDVVIGLAARPPTFS